MPTFDNPTADAAEASDTLAIPTYFADPYSAWQPRILVRRGVWI